MSLLSLGMSNEHTDVVRVMRALRVLRIFAHLPSLRKVRVCVCVRACVCVCVCEPCAPSASSASSRTSPPCAWRDAGPRPPRRPPGRAPKPGPVISGPGLIFLAPPPLLAPLPPLRCLARSLARSPPPPMLRLRRRRRRPRWRCPTALRSHVFARDTTRAHQFTRGSKPIRRDPQEVPAPAIAPVLDCVRCRVMLHDVTASHCYERVALWNRLLSRCRSSRPSCPCSTPSCPCSTPCDIILCYIPL